VTESERLFEEFCRNANLRLDRVAEGETKSPDYCMYLASTKVAVEVKQIEANQEERALLCTPWDEWDPANVHHWGVPGGRIRKKISSAVPQLRKLSQGRLPSLLVIYDTIVFWPELADEYAVKVAMYGVETALISPDVAPEGGAKILRRWHGPRRRLTAEHNTTLSGLGLMNTGAQGISIRVYHNYYAACPLPKDELEEAGVRQFELAGEPISDFPGWREIKTPTS